MASMGVVSCELSVCLDHSPPFTHHSHTHHIPNGSLLERPFCDSVESGSVLRHILLPALGVPKLQMISDTDQNHLVFEAGKVQQSIRNHNSAIAVQVNGFDLGEI